jgi:hypothetical protein
MEKRSLHRAGKIQSQGNDCQGNGKAHFQFYCPDNDSPDFSAAFSILHPASSVSVPAPKALAHAAPESTMLGKLKLRGIPVHCV